MSKRNLTLSLSKSLIKKAKTEAAREGVSMNFYIQEAVEERLRARSGYIAAMRRQLKDLDAGHDLGTKGDIRYTRDELHER
ncbi:MAG: type II toxin-antitoxin system HicB family antitoxin [Actinobacteria bacterium]|nr:type II toxin-antitoxin system HicB family antitoxin [Actinomycetota bacterium]MBU4301918.1 type II toxin-antitoxin system HicB family antitoxin [Actinomycetota bacterium]